MNRTQAAAEHKRELEKCLSTSIVFEKGRVISVLLFFFRIDILASGPLSLSEQNIFAHPQKLSGIMPDQQHFSKHKACLAKSRKQLSRGTGHTREGKAVEVPTEGLAEFRGNAG